MNRSTLHRRAGNRPRAVGGRILLVAVQVICAGASLPVESCVDSTVRDGAYLVERDIHRLCVMAEGDDPAGQEIYASLEDWFERSGRDLNVELVRVAADDPSVRWEEYGVPSIPPSLPVVVLAGRHEAEHRSFFIHYWEQSPSAEQLEFLRTSPVREAIKNELVHRLAVLLYVPGTGPDAGGARNTIESVAADWSKKNPLGVSVVTMDRYQDREWLLLSFIGIRKTGPDWAAVVFGRGKLMEPLEGSQITEAKLDEMLELLTGECTCLRPPSSYGVDIPMVWEDELDARVVPLRTVQAGISVAFSSPTAPTAGSSASGRVLSAAMWTFGGLVCAVAALALLIAWRRTRRDRMSPRG